MIKTQNSSKGIKNITQLLLVAVLAIALSGCSEPTGMDAAFSSASSPIYEESMKALEDQITASQYQQLKRAINYLNMNSTQYSSLENFRKSLDGSSAAKIIKRADALRVSKQKAASG
ncbi:MAG: hypothetical protein L3J22_05725 [Xanthomonadales bacterium]|nr:hypothetical protein [Xanthomonadales bacterium]